MTAVPRSRSCDRRYYGVAEGIVTDVNDPAKQGRVKCKFPFFDDDTVSEWCRVRQLYAGNGYGSFFVPEVGDEVLVAFVHGDLRMPVVLGGLYNGKDLPSTHRAADRDQKLIRTKAGHEVLLDDTGADRRVRITTAGGHEVALSDQSGEIAIKTSGGQTITLKVAGSSITLSAASVTIDASSIGLGGSASEPVVLGNIFTQLFNTHVHTSSAPGSPTSPPVAPLTGHLSGVAKTQP